MFPQQRYFTLKAVLPLVLYTWGAKSDVYNVAQPQAASGAFAQVCQVHRAT